MLPAADRRRQQLLGALLVVAVMSCTSEPAPEVADQVDRATVPVEVSGARHLTFAIDSNDELRVVDADTRSTLLAFAPTEGGFVRGLVPMLEQDRRVRRLDPTAPYRLDRDAQGQLQLTDPLSDTKIDLEAFGPDAIAIFARLLSVEASPGATP